MSQESSKTFGDQARLLRAIEHAITYDRQAAPRCIDMWPKYGSAVIRFAEDDMAAVTAWAERTGATVVSGTHTYDTDRPWHEFGTRPGGAPGQLVGWDVDLWCAVNEPAPEPVVLDPAAGAELAAKVQAEVDAQPVEPEQEWLFTFGSGQQHDGLFVRIVGTYETARARMVEAFGTVWCAQYDWRRFDEEGLPAKLTELPESEWLARADAPSVNSPEWIAANAGHLYGCTGWPGCSCPDATAAPATTTQAGE